MSEQVEDLNRLPRGYVLVRKGDLSQLVHDCWEQVLLPEVRMQLKAIADATKIELPTDDWPLDGEVDFFGRKIQLSYAFASRLKLDCPELEITTGFDYYRQCGWVQWQQNGLDRRLMVFEEDCQYRWQEEAGGKCFTILEAGQGGKSVERFWRRIKTQIVSQGLILALNLKGGTTA
jgi:hypothetical protein